MQCNGGVQQTALIAITANSTHCNYGRHITSDYQSYSVGAGLRLCPEWGMPARCIQAYTFQSSVS